MLYVNRTLFKQIYHIHTQLNSEYVLNHNNSKQAHKLKSDTFCERVFGLIQNQFYDAKCGLGKKSIYTIDFLRYVPCPKNKQCNDPSLVEVLPNYQFTYVIDNQKEPT